MKPNWQPGHPTKDGVYWISVTPKHREPTHWDQPKTPSVYWNRNLSKMLSAKDIQAHFQAKAA